MVQLGLLQGKYSNLPRRQVAPWTIAWAKHGHQTRIDCQDPKIEWAACAQVVIPSSNRGRDQQPHGKGEAPVIQQSG